jgi:transposase
MIQVTPQMEIWMAVEAVDFRRGIDGLARVCREVLKADPFSGLMFVFRNKRATPIKILVYDGQGFWLCQKRLSRGRFRWWTSDHVGKLKNLMAHELQLLIWNGNPAGERWRLYGENFPVRSRGTFYRMFSSLTYVPNPFVLYLFAWRRRSPIAARGSRKRKWFLSAG